MVPSDDKFDSLESMIRDAGDYLEVCGDLRPRLLEAARDGERERLTGRCITMLAACLVGIGALWASSGQATLPTRPLLERDLLTVRSSEELMQAASEVDVSGEWGVVEMFCRLKQRQSEVLRNSI